jgi:uncharacterized protein YdeI (YjbR/CyaY-like superfamily)
MGKKDPRIDAYISKQKPFAQPILKYLRDVVHQGCPEVTETLKWSSPSFEYEGILCGFAAFKEHAVFGFWKHENLLGADRKGAMGSFGRLTNIDDLPSRTQLLSLIKQAMELNEKGVKAKWLERRQAPKKPIPMPAILKSALAKSKKAKATYDAFTPSHKREYLEWITEAKQEATRERRVKQAIKWMAEGKARNWKYM